MSETGRKRKIQESGWEEISAVVLLTNELANGALAGYFYFFFLLYFGVCLFFAVTGEMWPCKLT